jgi:hypothetical protein
MTPPAEPNDDELRTVRRALEHVLDGHLPYPAALVGSDGEPVAANAAFDELRDELPSGAAAPVLVRVEEGELRLIRTVTSFAAAVDAALAELHVEAFLPADDLTALILRDRARRRPRRRGVTLDDVRAFASGLPRTTEALVRGRVKFRVGRIVYLAFSRDETVMGFGFPKEERRMLVETEPEKFLMPKTSDLRYSWVCVRLAEIDEAEMRELVLDAWRMVVPKRVAAAYDERP